VDADDAQPPTDDGFGVELHRVRGRGGSGEHQRAADVEACQARCGRCRGSGELERDVDLEQCLTGEDDLVCATTFDFMTDVVLAEVDRSDLNGRPVLGFTRYPQLAPFSTGPGDVNLLCGGCRFVLVQGAADNDAGGSRLLIRCPACSALNDPGAGQIEGLPHR
jgi:hypothetical protein